MSEDRQARAYDELHSLVEALLGEMREVGQGLVNLLDGVGALDRRMATIEAELTKELPPSKTAEVLEELVDSVDILGERIVLLTEAVTGDHDNNTGEADRPSRPTC